MSREFSDSKVKESPYPDVVLPEVSAASYVLENMKKYGDNIAFIDSVNGKTVTFNQLYVRVLRCISAFNNLGLEQNDVVGVCFSNSVEYPVVLLATFACGAIASTCYPNFREEEILHQFLLSRPKFIFTDAISCRQIKNIAKDLPSLQKTFRIGDGHDDNSFTSLLELGKGKEDVSKIVGVNFKEDIALLPYSSGTTGLPKGVMLTHQNLMANFKLSPFALRLVPTRTLYLAMPMFHLGPIIYTLISLINGARTVLSEEIFSVERMFEAIEKHKISWSLMYPSMLLDMSKSDLFTKYDISSLKFILTFGSCVSPSALEAVTQRCNAKVITGYGLTECAPIAYTDFLCPSNSVGVILSNTKVKILDRESEEELGPGEDGEILVKGPQMTKGYFNNPEATAEMIDQEGWLHTGDIGHYDEEGILYVIGRQQEVIKYKEYQISPAQIESVLVKHSRIADAAVIGIPNEETGKMLKAFVVKADPTLSKEEVTKYIEDTMSEYKHLRGGVEFIDFIPRSATRKILRSKLQNLSV